MENKERLFLKTKQKLDELRLPAIFPIQCTDLISKLLALSQLKPSTATSYQCSNKQFKPFSNAKQIDLETRVKVLGVQVQKTTKENNTLHLQNIHLKQNNQLLHKRIMLLEGIKINPNETNEVTKMHREAEKQLYDRLSKVTKKHNDLLNKVYGEEDGFEKLDKNYTKKNQEQEFNQALPQRKNMTLKEDKRGGMETENNYGKANYSNNNANLLQKIEELKKKVKVREDQILRLQQKMSYDGLNINKLIKDFQDREASKEVQTLNHQVDLLNKQNFKLKDELKKVKAVSGRGEVLRVENDKLRDKIKAQKEKQQSQQVKIQQFTDKNRQKIVKLKNEADSKNVQKKQAQNLVGKFKNQNRQLALKIKELESQLEKSQEDNQKLLQKIENLEIDLATLKNVQQGQKIFLNYQIEDIKKKNYQKQLNDRQNSARVKYLHQDIKQMSQLLELNSQQLKLKNQQIDNLKQTVEEQQNIIDNYQNKEIQLKAPLHRQLDYTSQHLNQITQSYKVMQSNFNKLKVQNQVLRNKLQQANIRQQNSFQRQHKKLTDQMTRLLKANQQLRNQIQKSNTNSQMVQSSMIQAQQARQQLKKLNQLLQFQKSKLKSFEIDNQQLAKTIQGSEDKLFRAREENKKLRTQIHATNDKLGFLENQYQILLEFKKLNLPKLSKLEEQIMLLTNDLKQASVTHTLISQQNINLKKQIIKLQSFNRQLRLSCAQPQSQTMLRGDFNNLVGKYETLILVNKNLKQGMAHLKVENDEMMLDRGNFIKEANHLRLLIHELEQRNNQYKQSEELMRKSMKDLQKSQRLEKSVARGFEHDMSSQQLKSKIEEIEESYRQAMRDSEDVIGRSQY